MAMDKLMLEHMLEQAVKAKDSQINHTKQVHNQQEEVVVQHNKLISSRINCKVKHSSSKPHKLGIN